MSVIKGVCAGTCTAAKWQYQPFNVQTVLRTNFPRITKAGNELQPQTNYGVDFCCMCRHDPSVTHGSFGSRHALQACVVPKKTHIISCKSSLSPAKAASVLSLTPVREQNPWQLFQTLNRTPNEWEKKILIRTVIAHSFMLKAGRPNEGLTKNCCPRLCSERLCCGPLVRMSTAGGFSFRVFPLYIHYIHRHDP
jgi:hypothetical protein